MDVLNIPSQILSARYFNSDEKILLSIIRSKPDYWWNLDELSEISGWKKGKIVSVFSRLDIGLDYNKNKNVSFDGKLHTQTVYQYIKHEKNGDKE